MRVIGYTRVSTEEQATSGHSLEAQVRAIRAYCDLYGLELVDVFGDRGVSGAVPLEKRDWGALVAELSHGHVKPRETLAILGDAPVRGVVVYRLDRLFRDLFDGLQFFRQAGQGGFAVHSVTERIDTGSAQGRLNLHLQLVLADHERDRTAERTRDVMASQRERGLVTGTVPYGCRAEGGEAITGPDGRTRLRGARLVRDPATWPVRELIVALREGRDAPALSYRGIRDALRDKNIPSPTGGRWWALSSIRAVVEGHKHLGHLAMPEEVTAATPTAPDTGVSDHV